MEVKIDAKDATAAFFFKKNQSYEMGYVKSDRGSMLFQIALPFNL